MELENYGQWIEVFEKDNRGKGFMLPYDEFIKKIDGFLEDDKIYTVVWYTYGIRLPIKFNDYIFFGERPIYSKAHVWSVYEQSFGNGSIVGEKIRK